MEKESLAARLCKIQNDLKAPKSAFNAFGKYNYRSCEDIMEGLKPVLLAHGASLVLENNLEVINGILFRKSIATLLDHFSDEKICVHTYTQEGLSKKGMSPEQCSGSTASYGDKYVLSKMFLIDDTKDADSRDNSKVKKRDYKKEKMLRDRIQTLIHEKTKELDPADTPQWIKDNLKIDAIGALNTMDEEQLLSIGNTLKALS